MTRLNPTLTAGQNVLTTDGEFGTVREIRTRGWVAVEIAGTIVNRRAKDLVATELEPVEPTTELDMIDLETPAAAVGTTSLAAAILNGTDRQPLPAEKVRSRKFDGETCPACGSHEIWNGVNVGGIVVDGDQCGCHECGWTLINTERRNGIVPAAYLERYQRYTRQDETGAKVRSVDNGDAVARCLREMTLEEVYEYVSCTLNVSAEELHAKYAHLNNGGQRMNLGNRLRAFLRHQAKAAVSN